MRIIEYKIALCHHGRELGVFLKYDMGYSSRVIKRLKLSPMGITLNGYHARTIDKLCEGDILRITLPQESREYISSDLQADILYEDEDILILNKPAHMPCHQSKKHQEDTLGNAFAHYCAEKGLNLVYRPINRLDKDTTGAVAIAKNPYAAFMLSKTMEKTYCGLVSGQLEDCGTVEAPIIRMDEVHIKRIVSEGGQYAKTDYRVISRYDGYCLADFTLHTGRTHQIRVHMSYIGHSLLGDELYGGDTRLISRQALHCRELCFPQPVSGEKIVVKAPLFKDMKTLCEIKEII